MLTTSSCTYRQQCLERERGLSFFEYGAHVEPRLYVIKSEKYTSSFGPS